MLGGAPEGLQGEEAADGEVTDAVAAQLAKQLLEAQKVRGVFRFLELDFLFSLCEKKEKK